MDDRQIIVKEASHENTNNCSGNYISDMGGDYGIMFKPRKKKPWDIVITKDKYGNALKYRTCRHCGVIVSTRLHLCPMCHARIGRG